MALLPHHFKGRGAGEKRAIQLNPTNYSLKMAKRQRSHSDRPLSLLLAVICYFAGMFTGSIAVTLSTSTIDAAVICGDAPQHVARLLNDTSKQSNDVSNTTITSTFNDRLGPSSSPRQHVMIDFDGLEYKNRVENTTNTISLENARMRKNRRFSPSTDSPVYSEVVQDIIPHDLRPRYATEFLQFPITRFMLRQSRTITGNIERLHAYLKKLQSQQCTTILFLGGSVTKGHKAGGYMNSYPKFFLDWLNARHPCMENGIIGNHEAKFTSSSAHSSQEIVVNWPVVNGIESFDLVFLEFNINDAFTPSNPHALENKGPVGDTPEYRSAWYFEILLRRLLLLRKPDPVAIITFTADYVGSQWADRSVAPEWAKDGEIILLMLQF